MMYKTTVKIPSKHYVGMVLRNGKSIPLGFMTPWGEDSAAKKRIATVDNWARRSQKLLPSLTIDNTPMSGFKLTSDIRTGYRGITDKWRIEDPRGFELEISSSNLAQLMSVGLIDRGEITDMCVWARDGQNNILLSVETEDYKNAMENTKVAEMSASWRDVKIGNTVLLKNNITGIWLGKMFSVNHNSYDRSGSLSFSKKPNHVIYVNDDVTNKKELIIIGSPKLAKIVDNKTMSDNEAELLANQLLKDKSCSVSSNNYYHIALTLVPPKFKDTLTLSMESFKTNNKDFLLKKFVVIERNNKLYRLNVNQNYYNKSYTFTANEISKEDFKNHRLVYNGSMVRSSNYYVRETWAPNTIDYVFDFNDTFYRVLCSIKGKNGNIIQTYIE